MGMENEMEEIMEGLEGLVKKLCVEMCKKVAEENNLKIEDDTFLGVISVIHEFVDSKEEEISMKIKENKIEKDGDTLPRFVSVMNELDERGVGMTRKEEEQTTKDAISKELKEIVELLENEEETKEIALELRRIADNLGMFILNKRLRRLIK